MRRYLLDTHAILWFAQGSEKLSRAALVLLESGLCAYSMASLWEIAIKQSIGKIECALPIPALADYCDDSGFARLPILPRHLERIKTLPPIHNDPFDRLLIATALEDGLSIVTHDRLIPRYPVETVW